jgi:hypothetical protein
VPKAKKLEIIDSIRGMEEKPSALDEDFGLIN